MRSDIITIEPQTIQFTRDSSQNIKIINNTSNTHNNFFFCLYNTEKFTFTPDSFSLAPNQHKLITITLKIKNLKSVAKQFAYLKSSQINKRITLLINNFESPQMKPRNNEQGYQDIHTLSSRGYQDIQTQAIQKIIKEKEAYISQLERQGIPRSINYRTQESAQKLQVRKKQVEEMEIKLAVVENQKQVLLKETILIQQKFEQYRKCCEADLKNYQKIKFQLNYKNDQIDKLNEEVQFLEEQGNQFLKKMSQKQEKISELERYNKQLTEQLKKEGDRKAKYLQQKLQEQRKNYSNCSKSYEQKIKQMEQKIEISQTHRDRINLLQKQVKKKEDEMRSLMKTIEQDRNIIKQYDNERKKLIKLELLNQSVSQRNNQLTSRLKQMEKINHNLKQQVFVYKNKLASNDTSSDKMGQYLQIALESCRNENEVLKRNKQDLQKSVQQFMFLSRQNHDHSKTLNEQISKYKQQVNLLCEIKEAQERRLEEVRQQHHLSLMKLKSENIELLQKLSLGQTSKRQQIIMNLKEQLEQKNHLINKYQSDQKQSKALVDKLEKENQKLTQKVKRYKKQARKQLKNINDTAINQLNKEHEQKKQMANRIIQLEEAIINNSIDKAKEGRTRQKSLKQDETLSQISGNKTKKPRSSSRVIGIKNQRKQIEENQQSRFSLNENIYAEIGQLRELDNYIRNEESRLTRLFQLDDPMEQNTQTRSIYRVIAFFKKIQNKLREVKDENEIKLLKQIQFSKGRIKQLQQIKEERDINISCNLNKTKEHCGQLLQFVREEMKSQYKKLNETLKLQESKYQLLKKKIYDQYRAKIVQIINKKDKTSVTQIETILERFIDGMSNLSHKQAVLQKQVKLKQNARKQNNELKEKVTELNHLLQSKKGYCSRQPLKLFYNQTEAQWQETLKRQAEFLTLTAQYQRMKQQLDDVNEQLQDLKSQNKRYAKQIDEKSDQILRMKKYQLQIQSNYQIEIQNQYQIIEENKKKILEMSKISKESLKQANRQKQYNNMKEDLEKKKDIIRKLRQKQKKLEEIFEQSHRSEEKERKKINQQNRVQETIRDLKDNNRDLRNQNSKLKQKLARLEQQLEKKNTYLKNLKGDVEQNRIRAIKKDEIESDRLRDQIKKITQQLKKNRQEFEKIKKKKQKQISDLKNEIEKVKNQSLITQKSLQSIIRALMDSLRKIYNTLKRMLKKQGKQASDNQKLFDCSQGMTINALKIDQALQQLLTSLEQN